MGEQFEISHRIAHLKLKPTVLVIFEDRQRPELLGSNPREIDNWVASIVEHELAAFTT